MRHRRYISKFEGIKINKTGIVHMKKVLIILAFMTGVLSLSAQEIKGSYCELVEIAAFGKSAVVIYHGDKMDALIDDAGKKVSSNMGITLALDIMSERGWELVSTYVSEKGGAKYLTYLLRKKKP
jgi:hypothetical protein